MTKSYVVDAHQHFWDPSTAHYPWMTEELAMIRRPFTPDDLRPHLTKTGVECTILVQTRSSLEETREFLGLAAQTEFVAGVVGWVDLTHPDVGSVLKALKAERGGSSLVGIRHQVHDEEDARWLVREDVQRGIRAVGEADLVYDLLVRTRELRAALDVVRRIPEVRFVIDHIAKPPIKTGEMTEWAEAMAPFAVLENVSCKVSGMVTEADWAGWKPDDLVPYVQRVLGWFGPDRLLFGSDWPVCLVAASYEQVFDACRYALGDLSPDASAKVFGENATRIYKLALQPEAVSEAR